MQFGVAWMWPRQTGFFEPYDDEVEGHESSLMSLFEEKRQSWVPLRASSLRMEELSMKQVMLPPMPCRWKHCCECVHLGLAWCSRGHCDHGKLGV